MDVEWRGSPFSFPFPRHARLWRGGGLGARRCAPRDDRVRQPAKAIDAEVFVRIVDSSCRFGTATFRRSSPIPARPGRREERLDDARLDQFDAFDLDLRVFPFRGRFFVGSSFGRQSLKAQ